jgi:type I restriction enzyme R subunit
VLDALLEKYRDEGMLNLDDTNVLLIPPLNALGTRRELLQAFGGRIVFEQAVREMQDAIYQESA